MKCSAEQAAAAMWISDADKVILLKQLLEFNEKWLFEIPCHTDGEFYTIKE